MPTAFLPKSGGKPSLIAESRIAIRAVPHGNVPRLLATIEPKVCVYVYEAKAAAIAILLSPRSLAQALKSSSQRIDKPLVPVDGFHSRHIPIPFELLAEC
jgi:hypothetical protein